MITGLNGSITIANGSDVRSFIGDGTFTFTTSLASGASYSVTVTAQPSTQTCTVTNGSGTVAAANITNVAVTCVTNTYTVGVTVSGLAAATSVVLQNNAGNDLTASSNGTAVFTTRVASGAAYAVTVKTHPTNPSQTCTVTAGFGTMAAADINVAVACVTVPLVVTSIIPANNATNVSRSVSPQLGFSVALNASTLTPGNITLKRATSNVSAVSAVTPGAVTATALVTTTQLLPLTQYTLTVTGGIRGQYGES